VVGDGQWIAVPPIAELELVDCASQRKWSDLMFCAVAGWWSPHGFLITPFSIVFNVLALVRRPNPTLPSERLRKRVRMNLARHLANNHIQTLIK
jgi:hypothetical protein